MDDVTVPLLLVICTVVIYFLVLRWWRHRKAAKLADKLLADVVKGKDSYRR